MNCTSEFTICGIDSAGKFSVSRIDCTVENTICGMNSAAQIDISSLGINIKISVFWHTISIKDNISVIINE